MINIVTLLCACLLLLSCSQNSYHSLLTAQDHGKLIKCQTRQELTIELESNPSTGYTWQVIKGDTLHLRLLREEYVPGTTERMGAAGKQRLHFQTLTTGRAPLLLEYRRPWEKEVEAVKSFQVTLVIGK